MDSRIEEFERANQSYVAGFGDRGSLEMRPRKRLAILTCMDARVIPAPALGLREGDAQIIRNPGAQISDEAMVSLLLSHKLFGTDLWLLVHHTDCGVYKLTAEKIALLKGEGIEAVRAQWSATDPVERTREGAERLRAHPLVPDEVAIYGAIYQVETGRVVFL